MIIEVRNKPYDTCEGTIYINPHQVEKIGEDVYLQYLINEISGNQYCHTQCQEITMKNGNKYDIVVGLCISNIKKAMRMSAANVLPMKIAKVIERCTNREGLVVDGTEDIEIDPNNISEILPSWTYKTVYDKNGKEKRKSVSATQIIMSDKTRHKVYAGDAAMVKQINAHIKGVRKKTEGN